MVQKIVVDRNERKRYEHIIRAIMLMAKTRTAQLHIKYVCVVYCVCMCMYKIPYALCGRNRKHFTNYSKTAVKSNANAKAWQNLIPLPIPTLCYLPPKLKLGLGCCIYVHIFANHVPISNPSSRLCTCTVFVFSVARQIEFRGIISRSV